jgi:hypothetical protein
MILHGHGPLAAPVVSSRCAPDADRPTGPRSDSRTRCHSIAPQPGWYATLGRESIQHGHHVFAAEALAHLNRDTLPGEHIDHGECAKPVPIDQLIRHNVQGPGVIRSRHRRPMRSGHNRLPPPRRAVTQWQSFFAIQPIDQRLADGPALPIEQHANLPVAVADSCLGQLPDPLSERGAGIAMALVVVRGPRTADGPADAPLTDRIGRAQIAHHDPFPRGP